MNDATSPLEPDELDELLSAELDGEHEAAARDLGLSADEAAARVRATPGSAERRAALAAARDLLSEPPELEELLAARLRAKAVRAAAAENATRAGDRMERRRRFLLAAGGIAAAIAAVVGVAASVSGSRSDSNNAGAKRAADASTPEKAATGGDSAAPSTSALGPFSDAHALGQAAVSRVAPAGTTLDAGGDSKKQALDTTSPTTGDQPLSAPAANSGGAPAANAVRGVAGCAAPPQLRLEGAPVLRATATLSGKPVIVLVFAGAGEHTVVVEDTNCTLLNVQMVG